MKRQKKERNWGKIFTIAVLLSFMAPIGYLVVRIISGDTADGVGCGREVMVPRHKCEKNIRKILRESAGDER